MKLGVLGFGHLAQVTAVGLASHGHDVIQYDHRPYVIRDHQPLTKEPGWAELDKQVEQHVTRTEMIEELKDCALVWAAYDTPLQEEGQADVARVVERLHVIAPRLSAGTLVILSSQWPIGTTRQIALYHPHVEWVYAPENVRVGHAVGDFLNQTRIIVGGTPSPAAKQLLLTVLRSLTTHIQWMSIESAEMTKHALNAYLALSVAFINEIQDLCKALKADAHDVARGLKSDDRIGPSAYLTPGLPFSGGSLQRDLLTLGELSARTKISTPVLAAIIPSNSARLPQPEPEPAA